MALSAPLAQVSPVAGVQNFMASGSAGEYSPEQCSAGQGSGTSRSHLSVLSPWSTCCWCSAQSRERPSLSGHQASSTEFGPALNGAFHSHAEDPVPSALSVSCCFKGQHLKKKKKKQRAASTSTQHSGPSATSLSPSFLPCPMGMGSLRTQELYGVQWQQIPEELALLLHQFM